MNKIIIIVISIVFLSTPAFAEWEAVTCDNEVTTKEMVQVKQTVQMQTDRIYTLRHLYNQRAILEADLAEINALITTIELIAATVKLKIEE